MRRFVVDAELSNAIADAVRGARLLTLRGDLFHHACRVLRLGPGAPLMLVDGEGRRWQASIVTVGDRDAHCRVEPLTQTPEDDSPARLVLLYGLARGEKLEWVLQKATELGVARIQLAQCERSVSRVEQVKPRWIEIVRQAARQCGRDHLPVIEPPRPFGDAVGQAQGLRLIALAGATPISALGDAVSRADQVVLAVGPEGGFSAVEADQAIAAGFVAVSLGRHVLRTETAAVAGLSMLGLLSGRL